MFHRKRRPFKRAPGFALPDLQILERFSERDLEEWECLSADLDEIYHTLYFGVEPERIRRRESLVLALAVKPAPPCSFENMVRIVDYRWSLTPLSAAGSLRSFGGRFNIGIDVDLSRQRPFPALYIASDHTTAHRERFQIAQTGPSKGGLTAEELALVPSTTSVVLRGHIEHVLDLSDSLALAPFCKELAKIKRPADLDQMLRNLKVKRHSVTMIRTVPQLQEALMYQNWRRWPAQFGVPSPSQIFANFAIEAGYEAIRYRSTKDPSGHCLAVFPANLGSENSFVEIVGAYPNESVVHRLDLSTAPSLCGWETVPTCHRPDTQS